MKNSKSIILIRPLMDGDKVPVVAQPRAKYRVCDHGVG